MYSKSESQSSGQSGSLDILVDVLLIDWFLNDFPSAEGHVSWGVKVDWFLLQGTESGSVGFNLSQLELWWIITLASFSRSTTLTILPKEGMTLMLMLLKLMMELPVWTNIVLEWHDFIIMIFYFYIYCFTLA